MMNSRYHAAAAAFNNCPTLSIHKDDDGWQLLMGQDHLSGFEVGKFRTLTQAKDLARAIARDAPDFITSLWYERGNYYYTFT